MAKPNYNKEHKRLYGNLQQNLVGYCNHINLQFFEAIDDDAVAYILKNVKGINMLDLNEALITDNTIELLTKLEYVYELRAKECYGLDDGCIEHLNYLTTLNFLYVKDTSISIEGLLKLTNLTNLKELFFTVKDEIFINEKMLQLKAQIPNCLFNVNSKPWIFK